MVNTLQALAIILQFFLCLYFIGDREHIAFYSNIFSSYDLTKKYNFLTWVDAAKLWSFILPWHDANIKANVVETCEPFFTLSKVNFVHLILCYDFYIQFDRETWQLTYLTSSNNFLNKNFGSQTENKVGWIIQIDRKQLWK